MPCSNCQKIFSQVETDPRDEEEIIKGLINCKECSDEIINRCHTCHWPIYKKELVYESSFSSSLKGNFWIWVIKSVLRTSDSNTETVIQCEWCYQQWQEEFEKQKEDLRKRDRRLHVLFTLLILFLFPLFWWELMEKVFNYSPAFNFIIAIICCPILLFFIIRIIDKSPKVKRHERRYRKKPKQNEK